MKTTDILELHSIIGSVPDRTDETFLLAHEAYRYRSLSSHFGSLRPIQLIDHTREQGFALHLYDEFSLNREGVSIDTRRGFGRVARTLTMTELQQLPIDTVESLRASIAQYVQKDAKIYRYNTFK